MRVVVTGGAGFIGANLVRGLSAAGHDVVVLDDLSTGRSENLGGIACALVEGSILDPEALDSVLPGSSAVIHLAAQPSVARSVVDPLASHRVNATGTLEVLEAARRHGGLHVVVASSSSVYGANPELPKHEDLVPRPRSPYAASKLAAESYALAHQETYGLPVLALRFFNVFGPLQPAGHAYAAVIPAMVSAAVSGSPFTMHGDGQQSRDFTYVTTVVEILRRAVERRVVSPRPMNLAYGGRHSLLEVLDRIVALSGRPVEIERVEPRPGDVRHSQADSTRLREHFPEVVPVELDEGLRATIDWFVAESRPNERDA